MTGPDKQPQPETPEPRDMWAKRVKEYASTITECIKAFILFVVAISLVTLAFIYIFVPAYTSVRNTITTQQAEALARQLAQDEQDARRVADKEILRHLKDFHRITIVGFARVEDCFIVTGRVYYAKDDGKVHLFSTQLTHKDGHWVCDKVDVTSIGQ